MFSFASAFNQPIGWLGYFSSYLHGLTCSQGASAFNQPIGCLEYFSGHWHVVPCSTMPPPLINPSEHGGLPKSTTCLTCFQLCFHLQSSDRSLEHFQCQIYDVHVPKCHHFQPVIVLGFEKLAEVPWSFWWIAWIIQLRLRVEESYPLCGRPNQFFPYHETKATF